MIDTLLAPLEWVISALLYFFHKGFSTVLDPTAGITWALSIVGLVIVVRILIIPLFVRQVVFGSRYPTAALKFRHSRGLSPVVDFGMAVCQQVP